MGKTLFQVGCEWICFFISVILASIGIAYIFVQYTIKLTHRQQSDFKSDSIYVFGDGNFNLNDHRSRWVIYHTLCIILSALREWGCLWMILWGGLWVSLVWIHITHLTKTNVQHRTSCPFILAYIEITTRTWVCGCVCACITFFVLRTMRVNALSMANFRLHVFGLIYLMFDKVLQKTHNVSYGWKDACACGHVWRAVWLFESRLGHYMKLIRNILNTKHQPANYCMKYFTKEHCCFYKC